MTIKEIIKTVNNANVFSLTDAVKCANLHKEDMVVNNANLSKHKYFDMVTNVYKCDDGYIGITGLTNNTKKKKYDVFGIKSFAEEYRVVAKGKKASSYSPKAI